MADFAPNVTPRYRLHYHVATRDHTIMCRGARGITFTAMETLAINVWQNLFTNLNGLMFDDLAVNSAEIALTDSDLFFPAALPAVGAGAIAIALMSKQDSISHITFSGRGSLGSKVNMKVYGTSTNPDALPANVWSDFVLLATENAGIAAAIDDLNLAGNGLVTVDNSKPVFAQRVTVKPNDFWLKRVRQGL